MRKCPCTPVSSGLELQDCTTHDLITEHALYKFLIVFKKDFSSKVGGTFGTIPSSSFPERKQDRSIRLLLLEYVNF